MMDFEIIGPKVPDAEEQSTLKKIDFTKALEEVSEDKHKPTRESMTWGGQ
jgi:hypothetical protein